MLISLGPHPDRPDGPSGLLLACHDRIRAFAAMAARLAEVGEAPDDRVRDACERLLRYFGTAFPLHHQDEEESVLPRLRPGASPTLAAALDAVSAQHAEIDAVLGRLLAHWAEIRERPGELRARGAELRALTGRIGALFEAHLALEEAELLPALDGLSEAERQAIAEEMRARRLNAAAQGSPGP